MPEELRIVIEDSAAAAGGTPGAPVSPDSPAATEGGGPSERKIFDAVPIEEATGAAGVKSAVAAGEGIAKAAVSGDVFGAATSAITTAGAAAGGVVAAAAGAVAVGLGVAAFAAHRFSEAIESNVSRLAAFNADIANAQAQTELRREFADRRRAEEIGPELASAERLRGRFEDVMTDTGTEVLKTLLKILDQFNPLLDTVLKILEAIQVALPVIIATAIDTVLSAFGLKGAVDVLKVISKALEKIGAGGDDDGLVNGMDPFAAAFAGEAFRLPPQLKGFNPFDVPIAAPRRVPPPDVNAGRRGGP